MFKPDPNAEVEVLLEVKHRDGVWVIRCEQIPGLFIGSRPCATPDERQAQLKHALADVVTAWELLATLNKGVAMPPSQLKSEFPKE